MFYHLNFLNKNAYLCHLSPQIKEFPRSKSNARNHLNKLNVSTGKNNIIFKKVRTILYIKLKYLSKYYKLLQIDANENYSLQHCG